MLARLRIVLVIAGVGLAGQTVAATTSVLRVPDLSDPAMRQLLTDQVNQLCRMGGFAIAYQTEASDLPRGSFVRQAPAAGSFYRCGDAVTVVTAVPAAAPAPPAAAPPIDLSGLWFMPDLKKPGGEAKLAERWARHCSDAELPIVERIIESDEPRGTVLDQRPRPHRPLSCASRFTVDRSAGPAPALQEEPPQPTPQAPPAPPPAPVAPPPQPPAADTLASPPAAQAPEAPAAAPTPPAAEPSPAAESAPAVVPSGPTLPEPARAEPDRTQELDTARTIEPAPPPPTSDFPWGWMLIGLAGVLAAGAGTWQVRTLLHPRVASAGLRLVGDKAALHGAPPALALLSGGRAEAAAAGPVPVIEESADV